MKKDYVLTRDEAIENYIRTNKASNLYRETQSNGTPAHNSVMLPKQKENSLVQFLTTVSVTNGNGAFPYFNQTDGTLPEQAELTVNDKVKEINLKENLNYDIKTYRKQTPIRSEDVEDSKINYKTILDLYVDNVTRNTQDKEICKVLQTTGEAAEKKANDVIDLLFKYNNAKIVATQSSATKLAKENNIYLTEYLKNNLYIVPDSYLGEGNLFVGDLQKVIYFDRAGASIKWVDHSVFGTNLFMYLRFDVQSLPLDFGQMLRLA